MPIICFVGNLVVHQPTYLLDCLPAWLVCLPAGLFACLLVAIRYLWLYRQTGERRSALWVVLGLASVRQGSKSAIGAPQSSEEPPLSHIPVRQFGSVGGGLVIVLGRK